MGIRRIVASFLAALLIVIVVSPIYRDLLSGMRDRYRGASFANFVGHLEYDRRVLHDFSWGAWFWNPDKAMGIPRFGEVLNRPLYPVHLLAVAFLPTLAAWHWINVFHVLLKLAGLVLLGFEFGWPFWLVVMSASGTMLAEGSLNHFGDVIDLAAAAWLPLQLWLTLKVLGRVGWTRWDTWWVICAALRFLGSNPNRLFYYELLILAVTMSFGWGRWRKEAAKLALRYALTLLLVAPLVLPTVVHFAASARSHFLEFEDWPFRRAYDWRKHWLRLSQLREVVFLPLGVWVTLLLAVILARGRTGRLAYALGGYFAFAVLHSVRYAPLWFLLVLFPGVRIPQKAFEPLTWLTVLALADAVYRQLRTPQSPLVRVAAVVLLAAGLASAAWQATLGAPDKYISLPWTRPLPQGLAAIIKSEPRAYVLLATSPERASDDHEPLLNSNHHFFLGIPSARFFGDVPTHAFMRGTYRVPGLLHIQRLPTPVAEWESVIDLYAELGIRWVIWDGDPDPVHPRLRFRGFEHGFRLYEITGSRPLVYALGEFRIVPEPSRPSDVMNLVYTLPALGPFCYGCAAELRGISAEASEVRWDWHPGRVRATVESPRGTYVVLGETFSAGWRATVDGHVARIYRVNEIFQAVWVPPGRHDVVWQYTEPSFFVGLAVAAVGAVACGILPRLRKADTA